MPKKPPMTGSEKQPPNRPVLKNMIPGGSDGSFLAWDQNGLYWIWAGIRRRSYVCSQGITHRRYWRTLWDQGTDDYVACDHEVDVEISAENIEEGETAPKETDATQPT